jgi:hypothetical protein
LGDFKETVHEIWGGSQTCFLPFSFDFKKTFVDDKPRFELAVAELKQLLKLVNSSSESVLVAALKMKEMAKSSNLPHLHVFRLQLFIPLAALCGLVLPDHLVHADHIEPSDGVNNGSFSALNDAGFPRHGRSDTLNC